MELLILSLASCDDYWRKSEVQSGDLLLYFLKALMHHINIAYCS